MFEACIPDQSKLDLRNDVHQEGDDFRIAVFLRANATDKNRSTVSYSPTGGSSASVQGYFRSGDASQWSTSRAGIGFAGAQFHSGYREALCALGPCSAGAIGTRCAAHVGGR